MRQEDFGSSPHSKRAQVLATALKFVVLVMTAAVAVCFLPNITHSQTKFRGDSLLATGARSYAAQTSLSNYAASGSVSSATAANIEKQADTFIRRHEDKQANKHGQKESAEPMAIDATASRARAGVLGPSSWQPDATGERDFSPAAGGASQTQYRAAGKPATPAASQPFADMHTLSRDRQSVTKRVVPKASLSPTAEHSAHGSISPRTKTTAMHRTDVSPSLEAGSIGTKTAEKIETEDIKDFGLQIIRNLQVQHKREERGRSEEHDHDSNAGLTPTSAVREISKVFESFRLHRAFDLADLASRQADAANMAGTEGSAWGARERNENSWIRHNLSAAVVPIAPIQPPTPSPASSASTAPAPAETPAPSRTPPPFCHGLETLAAPEGEIDTGVFAPRPGGGSGADCRWIIDAGSGKAIILTFSDFHLQGEHGHVFVYSGEEMVDRMKGVHTSLDAGSAFKTYTGLEPPQHELYVPEGEVLLVFQCEKDDAGAGFRLRWTSEDADAPITGA